MKIEQLPSGSFRIRKTYKGKNYSLVVDYKPTQKEAIKLLAELLDERKEHSALTFKTACERYIDNKSNVLSPSTSKCYISYSRLIPEWFDSIRLSELSQEDVQRVINEFCITHSPQTTANLHGLISSVIKTYRPSMVLRTALPQIQHKEPYIPTDSDVRQIMEYAKGSKYEVALWLGIFGMRRSEVYALQYPEDIDGNTLHINKALVQNAQNELVLKTTKTKSSTRDIYLPDELVALIHKHGRFTYGIPQSVCRYLINAEKELGLPHFTYHKLRHYYASMAHLAGVPSVYIQQAGGWSSDAVLKSVYTHAMVDKKVEAQQTVAGSILNALNVR